MRSRQRERQARPEPASELFLHPRAKKNAGHDSDYADERDGEHPPIERTFPEITGRTGDLCDDEQPTENRDRKGGSSRTLKTLL